MSQEREDIELLMARVEEMRRHQKDFFARRMPADKQLAIAKEIHVDELCRQFRKRGYNPDRFKVNTEQKKMF